MAKRSIQTKLFCVMCISLVACFLVLNISFAIAAFLFFNNWKDMTVNEIESVQAIRL